MMKYLKKNIHFFGLKEEEILNIANSDEDIMIFGEYGSDKNGEMRKIRFVLNKAGEKISYSNTEMDISEWCYK